MKKLYTVGLLAAMACGPETTTTLYGIEVIPHHYTPDMQRIDEAYLQTAECLDFDAQKEKNSFLVEIITENRAFVCEDERTEISPDYCYARYMPSQGLGKPIIQVGEPVKELEDMLTYHFIRELELPCDN